MPISRGAIGAFAMLLLAPSASFSQESSILTLADALAAVQEHNAELAASMLAAEAAGHRTAQAGRWPNPELTVYQERFPGAEPGADQLILSASQRLPLGGRPGIAAEVAAAEQQATRWDAATVRAAVTLRAQREYVAVYAAQRRLEAIGDAVNASRSMLRNLELRHAAGDASAFEVGRLGLEIQALELRATEAEQERREAMIQLEALTGLSTPPDGWTAVAPDMQPGGPPPLDEAAAPVVDDAPEIGASEAPAMILAEMERARRAGLEEKLARRQSVPDLFVTAGYSRIDLGRSGFVLSVGAAVPLFDRNRDAAAAAAIEERRRQRRVEMLERDWSAQRRRAFSDYELATAALRNVRGQPSMGLVEAARVGYAEGEMDMVIVLDTVRAELDATLRRIEWDRRRAAAWFTWRWASGQTVGQGEAR